MGRNLSRDRQASAAINGHTRRGKRDTNEIVHIPWTHDGVLEAHSCALSRSTAVVLELSVRVEGRNCGAKQRNRDAD